MTLPDPTRPYPGSDNWEIYCSTVLVSCSTFPYLAWYMDLTQILRYQALAWNQKLCRSEGALPTLHTIPRYAGESHPRARRRRARQTLQAQEARAQK